MKTVRSLKNLEHAPVLVRAALNVPIEEGKVANTFRLRRALPTIQYLQKKDARVILIGHLGDTGTESLLPVVEALRQWIPDIQYVPVTTGAQVHKAVGELLPGKVMVLENLRRNKGEKENDRAFAKSLASLATYFVQDSFDVCHREHASVVGIPEFLPSVAGFLVEEEVKALSRALRPKKPSLAIIGGAKFSTKEPVVKTLLKHYDKVFVGGALGNDFIQALGYSVGKSLVSHAEPLAIKNLLKNAHLSAPLDVITAVPGTTSGIGASRELDAIPADEAILDDGPKTVAFLVKTIEKAGMVLWNGPLGNYENGFTESTKKLAKAIAHSKAISIVGGGDTVAAIEELHLEKGISFISTGGGAMLDFLAHGTLPGLKALGHKKAFRLW